LNIILFEGVGNTPTLWCIVRRSKEKKIIKSMFLKLTQQHMMSH